MYASAAWRVRSAAFASSFLAAMVPTPAGASSSPASSKVHSARLAELLLLCLQLGALLLKYVAMFVTYMLPHCCVLKFLSIQTTSAGKVPAD